MTAKYADCRSHVPPTDRPGRTRDQITNITLGYWADALNLESDSTDLVGDGATIHFVSRNGASERFRKSDGEEFEACGPLLRSLYFRHYSEAITIQPNHPAPPAVAAPDNL